MRSKFLRHWLILTLVMYITFGVVVAIAAGILALTPLLLILMPLLAVGLTVRVREERGRDRGRSHRPHEPSPHHLRRHSQPPLSPPPELSQEAPPPPDTRSTVGHCLNCRYFSGNSILPCAVNPSSFPRGCREFEPK